MRIHFLHSEQKKNIYEKQIYLYLTENSSETIFCSECSYMWKISFRWVVSWVPPIRLAEGRRWSLFTFIIWMENSEPEGRCNVQQKIGV